MTAPTIELFKMQWPLIGKNVLIYNKDRSYTCELPISTDLRELFNGRLKIYVWASYNHETNEFRFDRTEEPIRDPKYWPDW